jgi:glycosyltransferase involved in cell wall biosynthesis
MVGPMPPPIHGQSVVMDHMESVLRPLFPRLEIVDTAEGDARGWLRPAAVKVRGALGSFAAVRDADVVYVGVKGEIGMWLTSIAAGLARRAGARLFLHHHSYDYVRERKLRMVALAKAAGPAAVHIVLANTMAAQFARVMPEISAPFVLGNASLIDKTLLDLPVKADSTSLVLGHLSDLSLEKGVDEVVNLAVALSQAGADVRLIMGGPPAEGKAAEHRERAARELGDRFEYRGILTGDSKHRFFNDITHFVFPSRYAVEAVPLVLFEAMAAGAICVATRQGAIPEQLQAAPCLLAKDADSFVRETLPALVHATVSSEDSQRSKQAYRDSLAESEKQLETLIRLFAEGRAHRG